MMFVLLALLVFVYSLGTGIYVVNSREPLPAFEFLFQGAFICGVI
jgi:hypothetical protein